MKSADEAAVNVDTKKIVQINIVCTVIVALLYGIFVFLCAYVAQDAMKTFVEILPEWLTHGFEVAGGILPAVGFAMLLKVMLKGEYVPYLLIGFVMASFLDFANLLPVAVIGTALGLITYNREKKIQEEAALIKVTEVNIEEDDEDGI